MFKQTHLRESCAKVIEELSPSSLELIDPLSHTSLELVPAPFICLAPSPSLKSSLLKPMDNDVMINLHYDLSLVGIKVERVEGRVNEFYRSLGNYKWFNSFIDPYWLCLENMPKEVI